VLFGTSPTDPFVFGATVATLAAVARELPARAPRVARGPDRGAAGSPGCRHNRRM